MILRLSLDLPEDASFIRTTRLLSRCLLEDMNVLSSTTDDVETIVAELCSNVIRHAQSEDTHFLVTLEYFKPRVVITVTDTGPGFDLENVPPVGAPRSDGHGGVRLGGFGLSLLEGLSDSLDYTQTNPHGTTVRVEKTLHYESARAAAAATERDTDQGGVVTASAH